MNKKHLWLGISRSDICRGKVPGIKSDKYGILRGANHAGPSGSVRIPGHTPGPCRWQRAADGEGGGILWRQLIGRLWERTAVESRGPKKHWGEGSGGSTGVSVVDRLPGIIGKRTKEGREWLWATLLRPVKAI